MAVARWGLTRDGRLTMCSVKDGRCNCLAHRELGESPEAFYERVMAKIEEANRPADNSSNEIYDADGSVIQS